MNTEDKLQITNLKGHLPNISVDCVIFGFKDKSLKVLLVNIDREKYQDYWRLPGDLVKVEKGLDEEASRILSNTTGLSHVHQEQFHTFGRIDRVPYTRVITVAYFALIKIEEFDFKPGMFASQVEWYDLDNLPTLIYDHQDIIQKALKKLHQDVQRYPIGFELLPKEFTLTQLQELYETILGITLDKRNFRRKIQQLDILKKLDKKLTGLSHRSANLYEFDNKKYDVLKNNGGSFGIWT